MIVYFVIYFTNIIPLKWLLWDRQQSSFGHVHCVQSA